MTTTGEIEEAFDGISYEKGAAVLGMAAARGRLLPVPRNRPAPDPDDVGSLAPDPDDVGGLGPQSDSGGAPT